MIKWTCVLSSLTLIVPIPYPSSSSLLPSLPIFSLPLPLQGDLHRIMHSMLRCTDKK